MKCREELKKRCELTGNCNEKIRQGIARQGKALSGAAVRIALSISIPCPVRGCGSIGNSKDENRRELRSIVVRKSGADKAMKRNKVQRTDVLEKRKE